MTAPKVPAALEPELAAADPASSKTGTPLMSPDDRAAIVVDSTLTDLIEATPCLTR